VDHWITVFPMEVDPSKAAGDILCAILGALNMRY
jgi:hypothetical protein